MANPSIYLETNIFSAMHYNGGSAVLIARRTATQEWWQYERWNFELVTSKQTKLELTRGVYKGQSKAIAEAVRLPFLFYSKEAESCAKNLVDSGVIPLTEPGDAIHLGISIVHRVDYLLTWNYAHLANSVAIEKLNALGTRNRWKVPLISSPENIPWLSKGEAVRRKS